ncbi:hypothetical protein [Novosphingobium sp. BW1]|uniref:hypothetical protein n=1 Tax=Novosphingobium sp. BW1 TaxID=2592621 RepID=UPI0011DEFEA0|nr:hypothetical protein [Novosphingobium sp. BW1]TYC91264.1 hypothetical protein FMM79_04985 [Novosphingobium sp. BW1]
MQNMAGTRLGAASNFAQGWNPRTLKAATRLGVTRFRDSLRWKDIERARGRYRFEGARNLYPDELARNGAHLTLTLNWGNPLYDGGETPHSAEALAAFGRFARAAVRRFPAIDTLEIGNEVNGANFVNGKVKTDGLPRRADYHLAMVRAASAAVKAERPDITVLGGATHSLPAGFLWPLLEKDRTGAIEGLALHPYTTPIDQLPAQFALLCQSPAVGTRSLTVTEFSSARPRQAPDDLVRTFTVLASLGATEVDWYPLNPRGDRQKPLIDQAGRITPTGDAFRFVGEHLAGQPVRRLPVDDFTFAAAFGTRAWVVWGVPRALHITAPGVRAFDAQGRPLPDDELTLAETRALVLLADQPQTRPPFALGCQTQIADSRLQFSYPSPHEGTPSKDLFRSLARIGGVDRPLSAMPGQERRGVPWTPYLSLAAHRGARIDGTSLRPAFGRKDGALVQSIAIAPNTELELDLELTPTSGALDVGLRLGAKELDAFTVTAPVHLKRRLHSETPARLEITVASASGLRPATADYRIRLSQPGRCPA